ncbi:MAG: PHP domain-containing protein, partial [Gemmatimonadetes bacterium]|nr:PHP domain-containing protein [Gemmatimonadota bacterium]
MRTSFLLIALTLLYLANLMVVARYRPWRSPAADLVDDGLVLAGALHMHTRYSDGSGDTESLARAASNAGLDFILITDHNTHAGYGEAGYYGDVLVLVGEERTTDAGHMLVIGARAPEGRNPEITARITDQKGGIAAIAHPYGRRRWEGPVPEDVRGYEVVNADNEWRDESPFTLLSSLAALPVLRDAPWNRMIARDDRAWATFD